MKRKPNTVENIKQKILELKGKEVDFHINRGRRKVSNYRARIEDVYSSVFTAKGTDATYTYSYNDILCGEVKISNEWFLNRLIKVHKHFFYIFI